MSNKINIKVILATILLVNLVLTDSVTKDQEIIPKSTIQNEDYDQNNNFEQQKDKLNGNTLNENLYKDKDNTVKEEEEVGTIPEDQSSEERHIYKKDEEEVGTIPEDQSSEDKHKNNLQLDNIDDDYEAEDNLAKNAFLFVLMILVIFIFAFIYNLIKCYSKSESSKPTKEDHYSRELQHSSVDDTVLDLAS